MRCLAFCVPFVLASGAVFAQGANTTTGTAGGFPVGPLIVHPGLDFSIRHDDNIFLRNTNKQSSTITTVSPYLRAESRGGRHKYDLLFRLDSARYHSSAADNYEDYELSGNANFRFTGRTGLKVHAEHKRGHDARGSTDRAGSASPDEYTNTGADALFSYGAAGARGRIEVDGGFYSRKYENNRLTTAASDRDTSQLGGTFYWRIAPKTELLFQGQHRKIDYDLSASTQDSTENRYYVGVKWEATAKTTGTAKFGALKKSFDTGARQDVSSGSWDIGVRWSPRTYSVVDLSTSKQTGESTGIGDSILSSKYSATWSHAWSSRIRTQVVGSWTNDKFTGPTGTGRTDDTGSLGLKVSYQFRRWLKFGAEYTHSERDSNQGAFNYKHNLILFSAGAEL